MAEKDAHAMDRTLTLDVVRVVEAAAVAAADWIGSGDEKSADQAAVDAMRSALNSLPIAGVIRIGEGERDEAPMLFIGEEVGLGGEKSVPVDIALDPLEGTTICARGAPNALAVIAFAEPGGFLFAPDVYMQKIAVGAGLPAGVISIDDPIEANLERLAKARGKAVRDLTVCVLDRPRHEEVVRDIRAAGARIQLIADGDVYGVIATCLPESAIDMYVGAGGAPEGVLAAAALRCIGGQIQGRLLFRNDEERARARRCGVEDLDRTYSLEEMAGGDVVFAAAGVTDGVFLRGVRRDGDQVETHAVVMRSYTGTVRRITAVHQSDKKTSLRSRRA
ncbi:MAG: class II fructose-bisphosphatase [Pseudomonadota bacterium]